MTTAQERLAEIQGTKTAEQRLAEIQGPKDRTFGDTMGYTGKVAAAIPDLAVNFTTSAVGEVLGGWSGILSLALTGDPDYAAERAQAISDFVTVGPFTEGGKEAIQEVAPLLAVADEAITDTAEQLSISPNPFGYFADPEIQPAVAATIKAAMLGGLELFPSGKPASAASRASRNLLAKKEATMAFAEEQGIRLSLEHFGDDLIEATKRQASDQRAINAPLVAEALKQQRDIDKSNLNAAYERARQSQTFIETRSVRDMANQTRQDLIDRGFDLEMEGMTRVTKTLDDLSSANFGFAPGQNLATNLNNLEMVLQRINKRMGNDRQVNAALNTIKRNINNFLDAEFNRAAIQAGQIMGPPPAGRTQSALSGDLSGIQAWRDAKLANVKYRERFSADKVIAQLISQDATPETLRQWLMGASAMNARREAGATVNRLKEILGDDHPSIKGIRQDFLFELAKPLFKPGELPNQRNIQQFINNYEVMVRQNPTLVDALDLNKGDLKSLLDLAHVHQKLPPGGPIFDNVRDMIRNFSRISVGHGIAKGQVRIQLMSRILNHMAGVDAVSPKQIMMEATGALYGQPAIPKKSALAVPFIAGASIGELIEDQDDR